ncbi:divalent-cation tolerance protein CutA [Candidatus Woesearchaeota archaeon]|nr:MAG: divalent-cation tolerance protein CutA [Candidatus Woesearchaeota archaeon]
MGAVVFVYTPLPSKELAEQIATRLVEKKLAACGNIFGPIKSVYEWEGTIAQESEFVLLAKTSKENVEQVKREIGALHPYTVPRIVSFLVSANKDFADWVVSQTKAGGTRRQGKR